ncbi:hypothetical protein C9374_010520 [Naegleria lovaniensis]|uniref:Uncharacterized protein n=1 Tax=Naegleria lovaniensis TaxID=51637 RepID=A0AA88GII7_NAELO|nr:uncharacterized protein C9374_010520 [Naegleria lovaniensis]KAG2374776.1 hypothetical protein C9374_010520 [Naegleria lovaniensis]
METVLSVQIEELTRLQEEEHTKLGNLLQDNELLLSKVKACEEELVSLQRKKRMLSFENQTSQNKLDILEENIKRLDKDIDYYLQRIVTNHRRREQKEQHMKEYTRLMEQESTKYDQYLKEIDQHYYEGSDEGKEIQKLKEHIACLQQDITNIENSLNQEEKRQEALQHEIDSLTRSIESEVKRQEEMDKSYQQKEQQEKQIRSKIEFHQGAMASKEREKQDLEKSLSALHEELQQLTHETNQQIQKRETLNKRLKGSTSLIQ